MMWPFKRKRDLPPVEHYVGKGPLEGKRVHLRIDSPDRGVLIIDASRMITLNGTGIAFARGILSGTSDDGIVRSVRREFRAKERQVREDLVEFRKAMVDAMVGRDVIVDMDDDIGDIYVGQNAPFRMDLALTYRCDNDCEHCYNEKGRAKKELPTGEWKRVLDRLWELGVPHIVFTGGEPTLRDDLPELVRHAESLGQITGLITNGRRLADGRFMKDLARSGLDHVQITIESSDPSVHDAVTRKPGSHARTVEGIGNALRSGIHVATNTTLMARTLDTAIGTVAYLESKGVKHISMNGLIRSGRGVGTEAVDVRDAKRVLSEARAMSLRGGFEFRWYTPTRYCEMDPLEMGLGPKQCTACRMNMAVEPDGAVIPCQSYYRSLGNILDTPWKEIWEHEVCRGIKEMTYAGEECKACEKVQICRAGCPLDDAG